MIGEIADNATTVLVHGTYMLVCVLLWPLEWAEQHLVSNKLLNVEEMK